MGVIALKPDETVLFPAPFQEDEVYPVVITTNRVVRIDAKAQKHEIETSRITFVGKASKRPFLLPGIALVFLGLPAVIFGIYLWVSVLGLKGFEEGEEAPVNEAGETITNPDYTRIYAIASAAGGLLFMAGGALLIRKQRFFVTAQAGKGAVFRLPVADKMAQTQVMMMIQGAITSQKAQAKAQAQAQAAMAAAQAPPPPAKR